MTIKPIDFTAELNHIKDTLIPEAVMATDEHRQKIQKDRLFSHLALPTLLLCLGYGVFVFYCFFTPEVSFPTGWSLFGEIILTLFALILGCLSRFHLQETTYVSKKREQKEYDLYQNSLNKISNAQTLEDAKKEWDEFNKHRTAIWPDQVYRTIGDKIFLLIELQTLLQTKVLSAHLNGNRVTINFAKEDGIVYESEFICDDIQYSINIEQPILELKNGEVLLTVKYTEEDNSDD